MKTIYGTIICTLFTSISAFASNLTGTWSENSNVSYAAEINVFPNGSVTVFDGCQNYVGWMYYVEGKPALNITYEEPISCGGDINQYVRYVNALLHQPTINFTPTNQMIITSGDKALVFTKQSSDTAYGGNISNSLLWEAP